MEDRDFEQLVAEFFADLPRKMWPVGQKETVWLKIQDHIRKTRKAVNEKQEALASIPMFRFGKMAITVLAIIIAMLFWGGATKVSEGSLPGDTLYSVKKAAEKVETILATGDEAKIKVGIKHAKRRLEEVKILVAENKETKFVTETLEALKSTTEQVILTAADSKPELLNHAEDLVAEEVQVLNTVKDQVQREVKQAMQDLITTSNESISRLKGEEGGQVQGAGTNDPGNNNQASSTPPSLSPAPKKPKIKDGVIESEIQIHDVIKIGDEKNEKTSAPEILPEPTIEF